MAQQGSNPPDRDWYRRTFDEYYPLLYAHRDQREARALLAHLADLASLEGGRVLDLGCGAGRYLRALLARRVEPIGLDLSSPLLQRARAELPDVPLVRADMRCVPFRSASFRWVLLMFTSFGYFLTREEDARVLEEVARLLEPGGHLVLDYINTPYLRRHLVPRSTRRVHGVRVRDWRWVDPGGEFLRKMTWVGPMGDGAMRTYVERLRLYEPAQISELLALHGLQVVARLGDYQGHEFQSGTSPRLLVLAQRGGGDS